MRIVRSRVLKLLCAAAMLAAAGPAALALAADDNAGLRKKALALNDVTGDDPIRGEVKALVADPAGAKKLVAVAVKMAKEKNQPFNYNGALILAQAALQLNDLEASKAFFGVCADQASKLQSAQKLFHAYNGTRAIIDLLFVQRKYEESAKLAREFMETLEKRGVTKQFQARVLRQLCKAMARQGKRDDAGKIADNLLKVREQDWNNHELKAWLLNEAGRHEEALKFYQSALDYIAKDDTLEKDEKTEAEIEIKADMLVPLGKLKKIGEANSIIDGLVEPKEKYLQNLSLKAEVQQEAGNFEAVAKIYEDLVAQVGKDDKLPKDKRTLLQNRFRYILSSVYVDIDRVDKATEQLTTLLAAEPNNPSYNNDLGYIWADHDQNLDKAEQMIRKALEEDRKQRKPKADLGEEEDKDKSAYLDSMGWVLFKKKNYPEAKKYLLEAVKEKDGQHVEIMDHLADVHMALGEKKEAIDVWKKALKLETASRRDKQRKVDIEKKLKTTEAKAGANSR